MAEIVVAVECLHRRGIVHNDLQSCNVLIDQRGHAVVGDFGIAMESANRDCQRRDWERVFGLYKEVHLNVVSSRGG